MFLDANDEEISFRLITKYFVRSHDPSGTTWASHVADVDEKMKDVVSHFALNRDLIDHIWSLFGAM